MSIKRKMKRQNQTPSGKKIYIAISDNHAVRVKAFTKKSATIEAAKMFITNIKRWKPEHGGIVELANKKEIREYIQTHVDLIWLNEGRPIDA